MAGASFAAPVKLNAMGNSTWPLDFIAAARSPSESPCRPAAVLSGRLRFGQQQVQDDELRPWRGPGRAPLRRSNGRLKGQRPSAPRLLSSISTTATSGPGARTPRSRKRRSRDSVSRLRRPAIGWLLAANSTSAATSTASTRLARALAPSHRQGHRPGSESVRAMTALNSAAAHTRAGTGSRPLLDPRAPAGRHQYRALGSRCW